MRDTGVTGRERLADVRVGPATLGLGTAALGRPGYITDGHGEALDGQRDPSSMRANAYRVFDHAYDRGIRYFDTARSYGKAEEFLASWLDDRDPADVFVASKWGYTYVAGWQVDVERHEVKDHSADSFRRQLGETSNLLGARLGLYQIHSVTPHSPALDDQVLLSELADLKATGVALGLTTSGPQQGLVIDRALGIAAAGVPLFDAVQTTWNLLETSAGDSLDRAATAGMAVIVKEAVANGRLAGPGAEIMVADSAPDAAALASVLAQSFTTIVLSGALTVEHLASNLLAYETAALATVPEDPAIYWRKRAARPWT